jgi:peroxiredoxin
VKRFHDKQGLNFRLLADVDHSVAHVIPKVSPKTHDEQVLAVLAEL